MILVVCFLAAGVTVQSKPDGNIAAKKMLLRDALANIPGWRLVGFSPLDDRIVQVLKLDDYANQHYSNGDYELSLYIGYYLSTKKVGAAHDPMVCMPGQGWIVLSENGGEVVLDTPNRERISYSSMILQKGEAKQLVVYWFQAYDTPAPTTFQQKLCSFYNKITSNREDNAFVRISGFLPETDIDIIAAFIEKFYIKFLSYVKQNVKA